MREPKGTVIYCNHKECLHLIFFEEGPKHPPGRAPADWDEGYPGYCGKKAIGVKVRVVEDLKLKLVIPECLSYARRKDWRIHLPDPGYIAKHGGRILGSQEHDSSR